MYVLVVAISGGDVVATSVVAKSAPSKNQRVCGLVPRLTICENEVFPRARGWLGKRGLCNVRCVFRSLSI